MTYEEHENTYCVNIKPPAHAEEFDTYPDACCHIDFREETDEVGGFHPVSKWEGKYYAWRDD